MHTCRGPLPKLHHAVGREERQAVPSAVRRLAQKSGSRTRGARPLSSPLLVGEDCTATEWVWREILVASTYTPGIQELPHVSSDCPCPRPSLQTDIGWHPYVESWVQARTLESEKVVLEGLFNR